MLFDQDISFDDRDTNLSLDTSRLLLLYTAAFLFHFIFFLREFLFRWGFQTFTNGEFDSRKFVEHFAVNNGTIQSRVEAEKKKREKEKLCFLVDRICSSQGYFTYSGIVFHY